MNTLAFDGRAGASGDMILGALLAAGADPQALSPVEDALDVRYAVDRVDENGIEATRVRVLLDGVDGDQDTEDSHSNEHGHHDHHHDAGDHDHHADDHHHDAGDHDHHHGDDHHHEDGEAHTAAEGHGQHRPYSEVIEIVQGMDFPESVESDAVAIFELLGEAEASVHGTEVVETAFHEVGADDAIADVVGAALLIDDLEIDRITTTPLAVGGGEVEMSHGTYPIPGPAVVEIAERADWELRGGPVERELLTPTGAAILGHYATGVDSLPELAIDGSGYGVGSHDLGRRPNVLRALVGTARNGFEREPIAVLETNVDDVTPEVLGDLQRSLTAVGARDVSVLPTTMKKSRPGHLIKVVAAPEDRERVARRLAEETGTLGVREAGASHRWIAARRFKTVTVRIDGTDYEVTVKIGADESGDVYDLSAEYDDAAEVADRTGRPLREIARRAEEAARRAIDE